MRDLANTYTARNRLAQMLMAQEQAAPEIRSHTQGLASMLRQGLAGYMQGADIRDRRAAQSAMMQALTAGPTTTSAPMPAGVYGPGAPVTTSAFSNAASALSGLGDNEYATELGQQMSMMDLQRRQQLEDAKVAREQARQDLETKFNYQKELANLKPSGTSSMRDYEYAKQGGYNGTFTDWMLSQNAARSGAMYDPQAGKMVPIPGSKGAIDAAKLEGEQKLKEGAKTSMSGTLANMANKYIRLNELGGVVDPRKGAFENIGARISSSDIGQEIGGTIGTEEASVRKSILNMRPTLINMVRQATGMSAKGMDSNQELKFFLQTATDPQGDIVSNLAAIDALDQTYGDGNVLSGLPVDLQEAVKAQSGALLEKNVLPSKLPQGVTEDDIQATMQANNMTREQVLERLAGGL